MPQNVKDKNQTSGHSIKSDAGALTIGLLQHEIDGLLKHHHEKNKQKLEQSITKELAKLLPKEEITSRKRNHHTDIVVKSIRENASHSPFVVDLTKLLEQKQKKHEVKNKIRSFFSRKTAGAAKEADINMPFPQPTILSEHEETISECVIVGQTLNQNNLHKQFTAKPLFYHSNIPLRWRRTVIYYLAIALIVVLPIKALSHFQDIKKSQQDIYSYAASAYEDLKIAGQELNKHDFSAAADKFSDAEKNFSQAGLEIKKIDAGIAAILKILPTENANLADAEYLIESGKLISQLGEKITSVINIITQPRSALIAKIKDLSVELDKTSPPLRALNENLNQVRDKAIPEEKRPQFSAIKNYLQKLSADISDLQGLSKSLLKILGADYKQRYLVVFQNNNELRPTGGFMGSIALVDIDRGKIKNIEIPGGGTYDFQGQLLANHPSPAPLQLINARWELQDANWFPDFPTSAKKIKWFYESSGGPTIDGVIAINAGFIPELLKLTGPISLAEQQQTFDSNNFIVLLQNIIERKKYSADEKRPKMILSELTPKIIEKLLQLQNQNAFDLADTIRTALEQKDIQIFFNNPGLQEKFSAYGWTGELLNTSKDYLNVVSANIGGGKTDSFIDQKIDLLSDVMANGDIVNTVTITRHHNGKANDQFGKISNLSFVRFYTPYGSKLLSTQGFQEVPSEAFEKIDAGWQTDETLADVQGELYIDQETDTQINHEFNKTVFGNWIQTDAGEETIVTIKYLLPFKFPTSPAKKYLKIFSTSAAKSPFHSLLWQKQSGAQNTSYTAAFNLQNAAEIDWQIPSNLEKAGQTISYKSSDRQDSLIAFTIK